MDDCRIIQLYLDRDEEAIKHTSDKYGARLRSLSYGITRDRETSEECENDTYMETWFRIPPNEPNNYFYPFLAKIARSFAIGRCRECMRLKRAGTVIALTDELEMCIPSVNDVAGDVEARLLGEAISRYLLALPEERAVMFIRRYFYLDTISEIADRLSISDSKVKTTLFRMRKGIRDYLIKEGYTI